MQDFIQLIPFNPSKGGNVPNLCLVNVSEGYGIGNKYATAWEAWQHTQQHPDQNIPVGLDVPLYYAYTTTLDGVTQNYGHVNVHLANGTVWSDGNIYTSIADYESKKLPRFVGWGESVNDYKIIQGDNMKPDPNQVNQLVTLCWGPGAATQDDISSLNAQPTVQAMLNALLGDNRTAVWDKRVYELIAQPPSNLKPYSGPQLFTQG